MLKDISVLPISQGLLVECLVRIDWKNMKNPQSFWSAVGQKCLNLTQPHLVNILEAILKERATE